MDAFASLAQLGAGLALALSIFLEPITIRERRFRDRLQRELWIIPQDGSERSQTRANDIYGKIIELDAAVKRAQELATWPLWLVKLGAALNFVVLLQATVAPAAVVSDAWCWTLLAMCILPVVVGSSWLFGIAWTKIGALERSFRH